MVKLLIRFFVICVILTTLVSFLMFYVYEVIESKNTLENAKILTQGTFYSLDEYLRKIPHEKWDPVIKSLRPKNAGLMEIKPLKEEHFSSAQLNELMKGNLIYRESEIDPYSVVVYKKMRDAPYVYHYYPGFTDFEKAERLFGWSPALITDELKRVPEDKWDDYLKESSKEYGFNVSVESLDDLLHLEKISESQKLSLMKHEWVIDLPKKIDDSVQILYVPLPENNTDNNRGNNKILVFGPMVLPFVGIYQKYILYTTGLILVEILIFIIALLFARSLEKLNRLADKYGSGDFKTTIEVDKTSTLFPLFKNLKTMGNQIQTLILSHKELLNAVSHELGTPLSRLRFSLEFLKEAKNKEESHHRISSMENDIEDLEALMSEILAYAKLDRNSVEIEFEEVFLKEILTNVVQKFAVSPSVKIKLNLVDVENEDVVIKANEKYLNRALQNLIQNAVRFANTTVVVTAIKLNNFGSTVGSEYSKNSDSSANSGNSDSSGNLSITEYKIMIEDDGPGIPDEDKERVFDPFVQLKNQSIDRSRAGRETEPDSYKNKGYGLGLAIVKKIIQQHHGDITLEDSVLGGAKFIFTLKNHW